MVRRKGIIVYFRNRKIINRLNDFNVNITFISEKQKYLTGYIDEDRFEEMFSALKGHRLVKKIEASKQEMDSLNFTI